MPTDDRRTTFGPIFGILGLGIGLGLVIASFIVVVGTLEGTARSTTGSTSLRLRLSLLFAPIRLLLCVASFAWFAAVSAL